MADRGSARQLTEALAGSLTVMMTP